MPPLTEAWEHRRLGGLVKSAFFCSRSPQNTLIASRRVHLANQMKVSHKIAARLIILVIVSANSPSNLVAAEAQSQWHLTNSLATPAPALNSATSSVWQDAVGGGFLPSTQDFALEAGVAPGLASFGSPQAHDLALLSLSYGHMLGRVKGEGHWYGGNF